MDRRRRGWHFNNRLWLGNPAIDLRRDVGAGHTESGANPCPVAEDVSNDFRLFGTGLAEQDRFLVSVKVAGQCGQRNRLIVDFDLIVLDQRLNKIAQAKSFAIGRVRDLVCGL